jgi:hypothetical protein
MRKLFGIVFSSVLLLIVSAQWTWAQKVKVYDLGHYSPDGTWAELTSINKFAVAVGWGDVASSDVRMIGVPVLGPYAGSWFECGVTSGDSTKYGWVGEGVAISDTGIIVGNIKGEAPNSRAYAWTVGGHGGIDLGTLRGDDGSVAIAINNSGTLITGGSYHWLTETSWWLTPVAWTPKVEWHNGRPTTTWVIHVLPTGGLEQSGAVFDNVTLNNWSGWGVNDLGQIAGDAWSDNYDEIAVIWNPLPGGQGWRIQRLPHQSTVGVHKYTEALAINNQGDIAGDVNIGEGWCDINGVCTDLPALWKMESRNAHTWDLIELTTLSGTREGWNTALGINDIGDVVGVSIDAGGNSLATRWVTTNPTKPKVLGFPGDWSQAFQVNNFGIAVGQYGIGDGPSQAAAVAIH